MQTNNLKNYYVRLESPIHQSFRCQMASDSLDIDVKKKSIHELTVAADVESPYSIGVILGSSGSGKTTLAKRIFPGAFLNGDILSPTLPIIEQFPKDWTYQRCAEALSGMGLTSVPCWIRPAYTLSNGQRARAEAALAISTADDVTVIDEWTSVVDRTVAKVMSHCVKKFSQRTNKKIVLLSCHYDVVEWLDPDWVIDCNTQTFTDRRSLRPEERRRTESIGFEIREIGRESWRYFSKYHYLSDKLPGGKRQLYGLFHGQNQVGFLAFSNYVPRCGKNKWQFHFNRLVIHPDYAGFGLGVKFLNAACDLFFKKMDGTVRILGSFSSAPMVKHLSRDPQWRMLAKRAVIKNPSAGKKMIKKTFRTGLTMYSFEYRIQHNI